MNATLYSHKELVTAVWYKTCRERDKNPGLAHHTEASLLGSVASVLTPDGVKVLVALYPELPEQFARTVAWWQNETKQLTTERTAKNAAL